LKNEVKSCLERQAKIASEICMPFLKQVPNYATLQNPGLFLQTTCDKVAIVGRSKQLDIAMHVSASRDEQQVDTGSCSGSGEQNKF